MDGKLEQLFFQKGDAMNLEEIKKEVSQLPIEDINKFSQWLEEFKADHGTNR